MVNSNDLTYNISYLTGKPELDYESRLKSPQSLKAGSTLTLHVDYTGSPTPTAAWSLGGTPVVSSPRVSIESSEYGTTLMVRGVGPEDGGNYRLDVKNAAGSANASFEVNVRGELL